MHIFYNETFDFRIVIKTEDFHIACEKLREYINDNKKKNREVVKQSITPKTKVDEYSEIVITVNQKEEENV